MNLQILLVEDSPAIRENLVEMLHGSLGADVVKVVDGEAEARAWLDEHKEWSVAIVDLFIKDGSGPGVLMALRERSSVQRAVVWSNYATSEIRAKCHMLGADGVFDKASEMEGLLDYLATLPTSEQGGGPIQHGQN